MSDRISQAAYHALQQKQTSTGRSLAEIGEAALLAAGERAAEKAWQHRHEGGKTQPAPREARKRYVVGIDPGVKTGFAVWDRETRSLECVLTLDFWGVFFKLQKNYTYSPDDTVAVIEVAHYAPVFKERKAKGQNENHAARMAQNVGQVMREAKLLAEGLRRLGYEVIEQKPLGKAKNAADDVRDFERLTGWTERTSQHARDAARICFQR